MKINNYSLLLFSLENVNSYRVKRSYTASSYRFGYQGSEKDNEVKGEGNSYTTYFRQLDVRLGRWLSIDPKASSMSWSSPYSSMNNNPISLSDAAGDSSEYYDQNGNHLFTSHDGLDNAIVEISNENLDLFNALVSSAQQVGTSLNGYEDSDELNDYLRAMGTSYLTDGMTNFFKAKAKATPTNVWKGVPYDNISLNGAPAQLYAEWESHLVPIPDIYGHKGEQVGVGVFSWTSNDAFRVDNSYGEAFNLSEYESWESLGTIHTHNNAPGSYTLTRTSNAGTIKLEVAEHQSGPSVADLESKKYGVAKDYRNIAIDNNYIYLYNTNRNMTKSNIVVDRSSMFSK